ncbi:MAG TPA: hypothetical protein VK249_19990 [Anaerolineales bacterium]|nr:hypothetical protein [Anaerolineales bacterium]
MPTSITPPPKDDEVECGNCGAYIYAGLVKCPNCGVYLLDPVDTEQEARPQFRPKSKFALVIESILRKLRREPHPAEELFTGAMREAILFDDLLRKVGGDRSVVERLIEYERQKRPGATRLICLQNAISRLEQENG